MGGFVKFLVGIGPLGVFLVALIDGIGVPIPGGVDLLLALLSAKKPELAGVFASLTVIGSLIGGMALFYIARKGGEAYLVKYTADGRGQTLKRWFLEYGLITVFIPALLIIPLPLKIPEVCAGALGVRPVPFFLTLLAARIPRYFGMAYLGAQLGEEGFRPWIKAHAWQMGAFAVALFAALYLMILITRARKPARTS